jgi:anti-sigma factor RsiW
MTCRELADFLDRYLAGDLPAPLLTRFEHHLSRCPNCVRYLARYRDAIVLGRSAFEDLVDPVPADVPDDLVAAILSARSSG